MTGSFKKATTSAFSKRRHRKSNTAAYTDPLGIHLSQTSIDNSVAVEVVICNPVEMQLINKKHTVQTNGDVEADGSNKLPEKKRKGVKIKAIFMIFTGCLINIMIASFFGALGTYVPYIFSYLRSRDPAISYSDVALQVAVISLTTNVFSWTSGFLNENLGLKNTSILCSLTVSLCIGGCYWGLHSYWGMLALTSLMAYSCGILQTNTMLVSMEWGSRYKGMAVGVVSFSESLGGSLFSMVGCAVINPHNHAADQDGYFDRPDVLERVPQYFAGLGVLSLLVMTVPCFFISLPPEEDEDEEAVEAGAPARDDSEEFKRDIRTLSRYGSTDLTDGYHPMKRSSFRGSFRGRKSHKSINGPADAIIESIIKEVDIDSGDDDSKSVFGDTDVLIEENCENNGTENTLLEDVPLIGNGEVDIRETMDECGNSDAEESRDDWRGMFSKRDFYVFTITYSIAKICRVILSTYYKAYGLSVIKNDQFLTFIAVIANAANAVGRLVWGAMFDRTRTKALIIAAAVVGSVGVEAAYWSLQSSRAPDTLYMITIGLDGAIFASQMLFTTSIYTYFGKRDFEVKYGLVRAGPGLAVLAFSFLLKYVDLFTDWGVMFHTMAGLSLLAAGSSAFLTNYPVSNA